LALSSSLELIGVVEQEGEPAFWACRGRRRCGIGLQLLSR